MAYKQLTRNQRYLIYGLWRSGHSQTQIAKELRVHKSTIGREIKRNSRYGYVPEQAQAFCNLRRKHAKKNVKFTNKVENFVRKKLLLDWSPEQISGYGKRHNLFSISHERIYQFILKDKQMKGDLYKHLRHQNKKYRKRYGSPARTGPIKNRRFIDERPKVVDEKSRIGDWEVDTIIGKNRKHAIVTIVERVSKKLVCRIVPARKAKLVERAIVYGLRRHSSHVLTITGDNGVEFTNHEAIAKSLKASFYFAHPYSSWERGLNENTNGLIRQYLPKGTDFSSVTNSSLAIIANKINNRPRKSLGFATPNEFFKYNQVDKNG